MIYLSNAIELNNNSDIAYYKRGRIYYLSNDLEKSVNDLLQTLKINPEHVNAMILLSIISGRSGMFNESITILDKAVLIDPNNENIYSNLSSNYFHIKDYKKSLEYINKAIYINNSINNQKNKAGILCMLEKYNESIELYEYILEKDNESNELRYLLAHTYLHKNNLEMAQIYLNKVKNNFDNLLLYSRIYYLKKDYTDALIALKAVQSELRNYTYYTDYENSKLEENIDLLNALIFYAMEDYITAKTFYFNLLDNNSIYTSLPNDERIFDFWTDEEVSKITNLFSGITENRSK